MKKRGKKVLGDLLLISIVLVLSVSIISASLLTDIQDFFKNIFQGKEQVASSGELGSVNPSSTASCDTCTCGTTSCTPNNVKLTCVSGPSGCCSWITTGEVCGGCTPSCSGKTCGSSDGCTGTCTNCNVCSCLSGQTCSGGTCIDSCTPTKTCANYPNQCGWKSDGCDYNLYCDCPSGKTCSSGACVSCTHESDSAFCLRLGKNCGSVTANDNCGTSRTVNCGTCTSGTCSNGICSGCTHESDSAFCSRLGKNCGSKTANDNCGTSRTVICGTCTSGTCTDNVCSCTSESDSAFCLRLGKNCGSVTDDDNCGTSRTVTSCGTCTTGTCSNGVCSATIRCSSNSQCGTDGWTGSAYCRYGNVYQSYVNWTCYNPGTAQSYCRSSISSQVKQTCTTGQVCDSVTRSCCQPHDCAYKINQGICGDYLDNDCHQKILSCKVCLNGDVCNTLAKKCCPQDQCTVGDKRCNGNIQEKCVAVAGECNQWTTEKICLSSKGCDSVNKKCFDCTKSSCIASNNCKIPHCDLSTYDCYEIDIKEGTTCTLSEPSVSSLSSLSSYSSFLKLFGIELATVQAKNGVCKDGNCVECLKRANCPKDKTELICKDNDVYERKTTYKCEEDKCVETISETLKKDCGDSGYEKYLCKCKELLSPRTSICDKIFTNRSCIKKGNNNAYCIDKTLKSIGEKKDCGGAFQCDSDPNSIDYGHCRGGCTYKDSNGVEYSGCPQCQKCFTWNRYPKCIKWYEGDSCTDKNGIYGQCSSGSCIASSCNPPPNSCQKCDNSDPNFPQPVADLERNGKDCTDGMPLGTKGFCKDGFCYQKNCQSLSLTQTCGSGTSQTCCKDKDICCGGKSDTPLCCDKDSQTYSRNYNIQGWDKINSALKELLRGNTVNFYSILNSLNDNDYYFYCEYTRGFCEADGKHIFCPGKYGSSCCPKEGVGSTCLTYNFIDPKYVPNLDATIKEIKPTWRKFIPDYILNYKTSFTVGICGDKACSPGTFPCSNKDVSGGLVCCDSKWDTCSYSPPPGPVKPLNPSDLTFAPRCQLINYCPLGYTTCKDSSRIWGDYKICCKNGVETCLTFPMNYVRCVKL